MVLACSFKLSGLGKKELRDQSPLVWSGSIIT